MKKFIGLFILMIAFVAFTGCTQQAVPEPVTTTSPTIVTTPIPTAELTFVPTGTDHGRDNAASHSKKNRVTIRQSRHCHPYEE